MYARERLAGRNNSRGGGAASQEKFAWAEARMREATHDDIHT